MAVVEITHLLVVVIVTPITKRIITIRNIKWRNITVIIIIIEFISKIDK